MVFVLAGVEGAVGEDDAAFAVEVAVFPVALLDLAGESHSRPSPLLPITTLQPLSQINRIPSARLQIPILTISQHYFQIRPIVPKLSQCVVSAVRFWLYFLEE